ncbi:MAG: hypothetical protein COB07_06410 [Sulfurovum sp.]|nr:MAG: hypothetical protein COB07_06410 [Sulfurovum sp.]
MIRSVVLLLLLFYAAFADEIRPAFLELTQKSDTSYKVLWKKPTQGETKNPLKLEPLFPKSAKVVGLKNLRRTNTALLESYVIDEVDALIGKKITIVGLESTSSDVLVRIHYLDGETEFIRVLPENPSFSLSHQSGFYNMSSTYFVLGVEHILEGYDHLLFVLALLLLVSNIRMLILTITAFTVAHTITLMLASFEMIQLSSTAVEAIIALSIVFVAAEVIYAMRGRKHVSAKYPWLIAFGFGLIHGLGFAGALKEIGLPQSDIVPSLIFFNVGVELGQLIFVFAVLMIAWVVKKVFTQNVLRRGETGIAYVIGSLAAFWLIERTVSFLL